MHAAVAAWILFGLFVGVLAGFLLKIKTQKAKQEGSNKCEKTERKRNMNIE